MRTHQRQRNCQLRQKRSWDLSALSLFRFSISAGEACSVFSSSPIVLLRRPFSHSPEDRSKRRPSFHAVTLLFVCQAVQRFEELRQSFGLVLVLHQTCPVEVLVFAGLVSCSASGLSTIRPALLLAVCPLLDSFLTTIQCVKFRSSKCPSAVSTTAPRCSARAIRKKAPKQDQMLISPLCTRPKYL